MRSTLENEQEQGAFVIVKPEGLMTCEDEIRSHIHGHGFHITQERDVNGWPEIARHIYGNVRSEELEAWLATIRLIYPVQHDRARLWDVWHGAYSLSEQCALLAGMKASLRSNNPLASRVSVAYRRDDARVIDVRFSLVHVPDELMLARERRIVEGAYAR